MGLAKTAFLIEERGGNCTRSRATKRYESKRKKGELLPRLEFCPRGQDSKCGSSFHPKALARRALSVCSTLRDLL